MLYAPTLLAFLACAASAVQAAENYVFDTVHSTPTFEFKHLGLTTQIGHFDKVQGTVTLDRAARSGSVRFSIDAASLNMGFGTATSASPGFALLQVDKFSTIEYQSEQLFFDEQQRVVAAAGHLTLLGVSKPVTLWVSRFSCAISATFKVEMCAANITANLRRSEYGMRDYIPAISDEVKLTIPVEAYQQTGDNAQ
jgi:polyisoprenoid-binding protein YceI